MIKKYFFAIGLIFGLGLSVIHAEVSEENWKTIKKEVLSVYKSPEAKNDAKLRLKTLLSLERADHPEAIKLLAETVIPLELELDAPMVLDTIITLIGQSKNKETILALIETTKKSSLLVKTILITGMNGLDDPLIINQLLEFLKDNNPVIKRTTINTLSSFHPTEAFPEVIKALESKEWEMRLSAIKYLKGLSDES
ncbi:MAG: HEAT repeat domain-containing protein, partial [Planctomycetota bacterium]